MQIKVFYSWQSDHSEKLCKGFIRLALQEAAERMHSARGIEVLIDSDTQGVPGTPPINDVILKKIDASDIFVADMTFVAQTATGKQIPNPNVMGEYGYALHAKGWTRILLTMNTAFGPPEDLPFDLHHHRHPATYEVTSEKPDTPRRAARAKLAERFEVAMNAIADDIIRNTPAPRALREPLEALAIQMQNARISNDPPRLISLPIACVHVVPAAALDTPTLLLKDVEAVRRLLEPGGSLGAERGQDNTQWWSRGPGRAMTSGANPEGHWYGRLLRLGIIEHVFNIGLCVDDDPEILVNGFTLEKRIVDAADRGLAFCAGVGLKGPTLISVSLFGLDDVHISGVRSLGRLLKPSLKLTSALAPEGALRSGALLRTAFDDLWLAAGVKEGSLSFQNEDWAGYAEDSAY